MKPVLPFRGAEPALLDPYWDYEHEPGEAYSYRVVRLWRSRLFATGRPTARVALKPLGSAESLRGLVGRILPAPEGGGEIWAPLGRPTLHLDGVNHLLGVDVTTLSPGAYEMIVQFPSASTLDRSSRFTIRREPFFTYCEGPLPRARSATGLIERAFDGKRFLLAAHCWDVDEHRWMGGGSYDARRRRVVALTWFDLETVVPRQTRISLHDPGGDDLGGWSPQSFSSDPQWCAPREHEERPTENASPRLGLPFPELVGLPQQPPPSGDFEFLS